MRKREFSILLLIIAYILLVGSLNPTFLSGDTLSLLLKASVILIILAIGQSFVLLTAQIDVSVGSVMGLGAAVCGVLLTTGVQLIWVFLIVILLGAIIGLLNGLGVTVGKIPSIIMTLGMLGIIRGCMILYTNYLMLHYQELEILEVFLQIHLMEEETTQWVLKNN